MLGAMGSGDRGLTLNPALTGGALSFVSAARATSEGTEQRFHVKMHGFLVNALVRDRLSPCQLLGRPRGPLPDHAAVNIARGKQLVRPLSGSQWSLVAMVLDWDIGSSPDVGLVDHEGRQNPPGPVTASRPSSADDHCELQSC